VGGTPCGREYWVCDYLPRFGAGEIHDLRLAVWGQRVWDVELAFLALEGSTASGDWAVYGARETLDGPRSNWTLATGPEDAGEAFVALGPRWDEVVDASLPVVAWTFPDGIEVRRLDASAVASASFRARASRAPVTGLGNGDGTFDFLVAGRSESAAAGIGMWVERRAAADLSIVGGSDALAAWEGRVDRPEPQALERGVVGAVLAWSAQRTVEGSRRAPACLYVTPLDLSGAPAGATIRVDGGEPEDGTSEIDEVRMVVDGSAAWLLWRRGTTARIARVDFPP
jgi:hypothetical protein